jgi:hypothetical protein
MRSISNPLILLSTLILLCPIASVEATMPDEPLQADWLFQADDTVDVTDLAEEWTSVADLIDRLALREDAPDLAAEREELARLESLLEPVLMEASLIENAPDSPAPSLSHDGPQEYTLAAWVRTTGDVMDILGSGLGRGQSLLVLNQGPVRVHHTTDAGYNAMDGQTPINDGLWHHVAQVVQNGTISLYIDGRLDLTHPIEGTFSIADSPLLLKTGDAAGRRSQYRFQGDLDQPLFIQEAIPQEQILQIVQKGTPRTLATDEGNRAEQAELESLYIELRRVKRRIFMKDPRINFSKVLFVDVPCYDALNHESMHRVYPQAQNNDGKLLVLDGLHPGGTIRDLTNQPGMFWRPDLSFDGRRVLFCMRPEGERTFHLYETDVDGGGPIRQVTSGLYDDLDPIYLPDGNIFFLTNRGNSYARCAVAHPSYVTARCDANGRNLYILSMGTEPEYTPALLPDGRVMYTRWEYTDKELFRIQSLWTMNPDGTNVAALWGNQSYWPDMLVEARPLPDSPRVIFSGQGHHDIVHGSLGVVDPREGFNYPDGLTRITWERPWAEVGNGPSESPENPDYRAAGKFDGYRCPYPLGDDLFLVSAKLPYAGDPGGVGSAQQTQGRFSLYLMDAWGNRELIYRGERDVLYAVPVRERARPPIIPERTEWPGLASEGREAASGVLYSNNVFEGVPDAVRERAKFVRVIHQDYTTFTFGLKCQMPDENGVQTTHADQHAGPPLTIASNDGIKRILGTVPIEADGSIAIEVPPCRSIHFQLLDEQYRAVHIMRSFTGVMPGERRGCVGCHEGQGATPVGANSIALGKGPVVPTPPPWGARYHIGYRQDIQPILDNNCGRCHQEEGKARERLDLTFRPSTDGGSYTEPYLTLTLGPERSMGRFARTLCDGGVAGTLLPMASGFTPAHDLNHPPLTAMSFNSQLVKNATSGQHNDVVVDPVSARKLIAWVDLLCPYWNEDDIRSMPDPDPSNPFFADSAYPPRTPGVSVFADSPYPPRMQNAPVVRREYCQDEFPTQADRIEVTAASRTQE